MSELDEIAALRAEQDELQLPFFDAALAWRIGAYIHARAEAADMPITFEVSRLGQRLLYCAMPGAVPDGAAWVHRKRMVVERFHCSSLLMKLLADQQGRPLLERYVLSPDDYCSSGGGVPVIVRGTGTIGVVTVSGLTQFEDHMLAADAIRHVIAEIAATGSADR